MVRQGKWTDLLKVACEYLNNQYRKREVSVVTHQILFLFVRAGRDFDAEAT